MAKTSKINIGCIAWGDWGEKLSSKEQTNMIQFCVENGNTTFSGMLRESMLRLSRCA